MRLTWVLIVDASTTSEAAISVFDRPAAKWAYRLRDLIPGADEVVEIRDGRLFFPDERAGELATALHDHWETHR